MIRLRLPQTTVYWPPLAGSGFGKLAYGAPVSLPCRVEGGVSQALSPTGDVILGSAIVYFAQDVAVGGLLLPGAKTTDAAVTGGSGYPRAIANIKEIIAVSSVPSLTGDQQLVTATIK